MASKRKQRLVVDASIARAAGGLAATSELSKQCRDFLQAMLQSPHLLVLTPAIRAEWNRHQSEFAYDWRNKMVSAKKVLLIQDDPDLPAEMADRITATGSKSDERKAMAKDLLLLGAALATDKTVVSGDNTVRALFAGAAQTVRELRAIIWVHPAEDAARWVAAGARADSERRLDAYVKQAP
ncbi:MAG: hypothetical protein M3Z04_15950 [Chloroflexota bacterium]|nr:hypothetical protein [Chloroflexota bacterium]